MSEFFSFDRLMAAFLPVLSGLNVTLYIMFSSFGIALVLGVVLTVIRIRHIPVLEALSKFYISFMRGSPIIVQLYIVYYGLPFVVMSLFNLDINRWDKVIFVILAIGLNEASFFSEIIRGAIQSVSLDQIEAGYSVGLTWAQTFRRVIFPQAIRVALPALSTQLITLLQSTALAYMFGVVDILGAARNAGAKSHHALEGYICATVIFVVICVFLEFFSRFLRRRLNQDERVHHRGISV